jgi:hypothetical protein
MKRPSRLLMFPPPTLGTEGDSIGYALKGEVSETLLGLREGLQGLAN